MSVLTHLLGHIDLVLMRYKPSNDHCWIAPQYVGRAYDPVDVSPTCAERGYSSSTPPQQQQPHLPINHKQIGCLMDHARMPLTLSSYLKFQEQKTKQSNLEQALLYLFLLGRCWGLLLPSNIHPIVLKIPLLKWCSINLNNGTLHQSLSTNKLIVRCIVHHIKNTGLPSHGLTTPWIITSIKPKSTPLHVTPTNSNPPDWLVAGYLSVGRLPSELIPLQINNIIRTSKTKHGKWKWYRCSTRKWSVIVTVSVSRPHTHGK